MKLCCRLLLSAAVVLTVSTVDLAVAHADHIDFGMNEPACKAAASQANAHGYTGAFCFQTGPGYYSLDTGD